MEVERRKRSPPGHGLPPSAPPRAHDSDDDSDDDSLDNDEEEASYSTERDSETSSQESSEEEKEEEEEELERGRGGGAGRVGSKARHAASPPRGAAAQGPAADGTLRRRSDKADEHGCGEEERDWDEKEGGQRIPSRRDPRVDSSGLGAAGPPSGGPALGEGAGGHAASNKLYKSGPSIGPSSRPFQEEGAGDDGEEEEYAGEEEDDEVSDDDGSAERGQSTGENEPRGENEPVHAERSIKENAMPWFQSGSDAQYGKAHSKGQVKKQKKKPAEKTLIENKTEKKERKLQAREKRRDQKKDQKEKSESNRQPAPAWLWDEDSEGWYLGVGENEGEDTVGLETTSLAPGHWTGELLAMDPASRVETLENLSPGERVRGMRAIQSISPKLLMSLSQMDGATRGRMLQRLPTKDRTAMLQALNVHFIHTALEQATIARRPPSPSMMTPMMRGRERRPPPPNHRGQHYETEEPISPPTNELVKVHLDRDAFLYTRKGPLPPPPGQPLPPGPPRYPVYDKHGRRLDEGARRDVSLFYPDVIPEPPLLTSPDKVRPPPLGYVYHEQGDEEAEDVLRIGPVSALVERGEIRPGSFTLIGGRERGEEDSQEAEGSVLGSRFDHDCDSDRRANARLRHDAMSEARDWAASRCEGRLRESCSKSPLQEPRRKSAIILDESRYASDRRPRRGESPSPSPSSLLLEPHSSHCGGGVINRVARETTIQSLPCSSTGLLFSRLGPEATPPGVRRTLKAAPPRNQ